MSNNEGPQQNTLVEKYGLDEYPRISAIIPFHNAQKSIIDTLEALQESSLRLLEVLCVDDASRDDTKERIQEFSAKSSLVIRLMHSKPGKRGAAAARNLGAQECRGDYLLFVDADVVVEEDTLDRMLCTLVEQPCIAVVAHFCAHSLQPGILPYFQAYMVHHVYAHLTPCDSSCLGTQCLLMKANAFHTTSGFDETYENATVEDFDFGYRLRTAGHKICISSNARIFHNHQYDLLSFVRNYYKKSHDLAILLLRRPDVTLSDTGYYHSSNWVVPLILIFLVFFVVMHSALNLRMLWGVLAIFLSVPILWRKFVADAVRQEGIANAIILTAVRLVAVAIGWIGGLTGLLKILIKTKDAVNWSSQIHSRWCEALDFQKSKSMDQ